MSALLDLILSLSISGGILALVVFLLKPFMRRKMPKIFQYYIWLLVLARLILPLPSSANLLGSTGQPRNLAAPITDTIAAVRAEPQLSTLMDEPLKLSTPTVPENTQAQAVSERAAYLATPTVISVPWYTILIDNLIYVWAAGALVTLCFRIGCYYRFLFRVKRNQTAALPREAELFALLCDKQRIRAKVTLQKSKFAPVPMLVGIFRPVIILPCESLAEEQLTCILLHELTHLRRHDTAMKWFTMLVAAIHWFNPIVYFVQRHINKACELSCDEAVIKALDSCERQRYGDTLIEVASLNSYPFGVISSSMRVQKNTLKERLVSIMQYKRPTKSVIAMCLTLSLLLVGCASALGVNLDDRAVAAKAQKVTTVRRESKAHAEGLSGKIVKLATGGGICAALDDQGNVCVWGNAGDERLNIPEGLRPLKDIAIGQYHIVGLGFDGKLYGWRSSESWIEDYGEIAFDDTLPRFVQISAGGYNTAAITADGEVYQWGNTNMGSQSDLPENIDHVKAISLGSYVTAALFEDGTIASWRMALSSPVNMPVAAQMVTCSRYGVYALGVDGKVYGEESEFTISDAKIEKPMMENIVKIAGSMALDAQGKVYAWGNDNPFHTMDITDIPLNLPKMTDIATDGMYALALGEDGKIYEWGNTGKSVYITDSDGNESYVEGDFVSLPEEYNGFANIQPEYPPIDTNGISETMVVKNAEEYHSAVMAYPLCKNIIIDGSFSITTFSAAAADANVTVNQGATLIIEGDVAINGVLENNGVIIVKGDLMLQETPLGEMSLSDSSTSIPNPTGTGTFLTDGGQISVYAMLSGSDDINRLFSAGSIFTRIAFTPVEKTTLEIDKDTTIPEGKTLWLNSFIMLKVTEGVTLTNNGSIETFQTPVIEGQVEGNKIDVIEW